MALDAGDSGCTTGLSHLIYDSLTSDTRSGFSSPMTTAQSNSVKALAYSIAATVVAHLAANAEVKVTVPANAFGAGIPAAPVDLTGTIT